MSMGKYYKNVPPSTGLIKAMIDADLSLKTCIAELIGNALDQDAKRIDLSLNKKHPGEFTISDDGKGCPNLEKMIMLGSHVPSKKGTIGRYGVGCKDAVVWLGGSTLIDSLTGSGKKESAFVDWLQLDNWQVQFEDDCVRATRGVTITVKDLRVRRFTGWKSVGAYVSELFSAAIDHGVVITVDGKVVKSNPAPLLDNRVPFRITREGLVFEGFCGILVDKGISSGWNIRYGWQTIASNCTNEGFGELSPQGFWGMGYMVDDGEREWNLTRNKNWSEDLASMLNSPDLWEIVQPLLEKLQQANDQMLMHLNHDFANTELTSMINRIKVSRVDDGLSATPEEGESHKGERKKLDKDRIIIPRKKREYQADPLSKAKKLIQLAQKVSVVQYDSKGKRFGFAELTQGDTIIKVYIDDKTPIGKEIWSNRKMLMYQAITLIGVYFGSEESILNRIKCPIGETHAGSDRISAICAWLFQHVDLEAFGNSAIVA